MKFIAGIDIGTRMTKCIVMDAESGEFIGRAAQFSGHNFARSAADVLAAAGSMAKLTRANIDYIATTGYGRYQVPDRQIQITEITCNAMGARHLFPNTRSVLDMGAQNVRAISISPEGRVKRFRMNDKCASGAGRFLERVAKGLDLELDEVGTLSLRSTEPQPISSICAVLAESEVINLVTIGHAVEDILMGVHVSISERVVALLRQVSVEPEVTITGGVSKNAGMVRAFAERLGIPVNVSPDAEYAGAMGACQLARMRVRKLADAGVVTV
jgi:predicted CoA-substrate-specific enzyme activase